MQLPYTCFLGETWNFDIHWEVVDLHEMPVGETKTVIHMAFLITLFGVLLHGQRCVTLSSSYAVVNSVAWASKPGVHMAIVGLDRSNELRSGDVQDKVNDRNRSTFTMRI
jgi:hypothetical protein